MTQDQVQNIQHKVAFGIGSALIAYFQSQPTTSLTEPMTALGGLLIAWSGFASNKLNAEPSNTNAAVTPPASKLVPAFILAMILGITAQAQTNNSVPMPPQSFLATAGSYFTTFNTNLQGTFAVTGATTNHGQLWTGATLQNNVNIGQEIGGSYNIGKGFSVEGLALNAGVFNTILGGEVGAGYSLVLVDTRITAILGAGERFSPSQFYVAGHLRLEKAITTHTFMGLDVGIQSGGKTDLVPQLTVLTGFTF